VMLAQPGGSADTVLVRGNSYSSTRNGIIACYE
jgi:hypothetical protein